jgi:hypothetical protein
MALPSDFLLQRMMMMINALLDFVVCGGSICGASCGQWTKSLQDDDADLWKDLTLQDLVTDPAPPVPKVVQWSSLDDDVSTLYDPHHRRHDGSDNEALGGDLELRAETLDDDTASFVENSFQKVRSQSRLGRRSTQISPPCDDCDGSSYSSYWRTTVTKNHLPQHALSWQTNSTDATMQTKNHYISIVGTC